MTIVCYTIMFVFEFEYDNDQDHVYDHLTILWKFLLFELISFSHISFHILISFTFFLIFSLQFDADDLACLQKLDCSIVSIAKGIF